MPVGTQASVKGVSPEELKDLGAGIILSNTYHLFLRPGMELVKEAGGLHKFMHWDGAILTDSGGFQVFSLGDLRKITEEGVTFRSHIDGSKKFLSPEVSMQVQMCLGSDIVMAFDECVPYPADHDYAKQSTERTLRWAQRCKDTMTAPNQGLFGIVQGGMYKDLRKWHAKEMVEMDFPGYAVGGLAVGETHAEMYEILDAVVPHLPADKPTYLMGVGTPQNILEAVDRGVDFFDCVYPSRNGRHGNLYTNKGTVRINNARYALDTRPIEEGCGCPVCRAGYSRAYIRHLVKAGETLGLRMCVMHNLYFYNHLMTQIREALDQGTFAAFKKRMLDDLEGDGG
jgi:queuine tRNA-ribosyltransferase